MSPSKINGLSNEREAEALGNFVFSTTITVSPLSRLNVWGFPKNISGAGPDSGIIDLSNCALSEVVNNTNTIITFFMMPIASIVLNMFFIIL